MVGLFTVISETSFSVTPYIHEGISTRRVAAGVAVVTLAAATAAVIAAAIDVESEDLALDISRLSSFNLMIRFLAYLWVHTISIYPFITSVHM